MNQKKSSGGFANSRDCCNKRVLLTRAMGEDIIVRNLQPGVYFEKVF